MTIDFGKTAQDYSQHRAGFPKSLFNRLLAYKIGLPNQQILDMGTGTGTMARGFARQACRVTALDPAWPLLIQGQRLDAEAGVTVQRTIAQAEISGLQDRIFDVVSAGQCWHWFERSQAAQEVKRLLKPGGHLVIAHFDWIPLPGNLVEATEHLILQHNPQWHLSGGTGLYPAWLADVATAGFKNIETFSYDTEAVYSHEAWRGRIRASAGVAASLEPLAVSQFDAELQALLHHHFPDDPLQVPHRVFALVAQKPEEDSEF